MKHLLILALILTALPAVADPPTIEAATARPKPMGWQFDVTLTHPDSGWDHYADGWRILDMNGNQLGLRTLHHPHEQEQPFTRSLNRVQIPTGTTHIQIQARCIRDGWNTSTHTIALNSS